MARERATALNARCQQRNIYLAGTAISRCSHSPIIHLRSSVSCPGGHFATLHEPGCLGPQGRCTARATVDSNSGQIPLLANAQVCYVFLYICTCLAIRQAVQYRHDEVAVWFTIASSLYQHPESGIGRGTPFAISFQSYHCQAASPIARKDHQLLYRAVKRLQASACYASPPESYRQ